MRSDLQCQWHCPSATRLNKTNERVVRVTTTMDLTSGHMHVWECTYMYIIFWLQKHILQLMYLMIRCYNMAMASCTDDNRCNHISTLITCTLLPMQANNPMSTCAGYFHFSYSLSRTSLLSSSINRNQLLDKAHSIVPGVTRAVPPL
jgi:hypothetical protein